MGREPQLPEAAPGKHVPALPGLQRRLRSRDLTARPAAGTDLSRDRNSETWPLVYPVPGPLPLSGCSFKIRHEGMTSDGGAMRAPLLELGEGEAPRPQCLFSLVPPETTTLTPGLNGRTPLFERTYQLVRRGCTGGPWR